MRFIHRKTGVFLGEAKLISHHEYQLTLDQDATPFAEGQAEWLDHECAGWVVQNCRWEDNFQRLLIMSGPGLVRGCTFTRMGSNISLNTGMGLVGGIPSDITLTDNTFIDVSSRPHQPAIEAHAHNAQGGFGIPPIERLIITGNTITRSGGPAMNLIGIHDSRIENNVIDSQRQPPLRSRKPHAARCHEQQPRPRSRCDERHHAGWQQAARCACSRETKAQVGLRCPK